MSILHTLTRQVDRQARQRAIVKWNEHRQCWHVDLHNADEAQPWLILALDYKTAEVIASGHGKTKNEAWLPVAEALGMRP